MAHVGLARTPRRIARLLVGSASGVVEAAARLEALSRGRASGAAVADACTRAERTCRLAVDEASEMLGGGLDRGDVLAIAGSLRLLATRIREAAAEVAVAPAAGGSLPPVAGVVRDVARELEGAIANLDGPDRVRDLRLGRADALHEEGRRALRSARAELLTRSVDPIGAIAGHATLRRLERALMAARDAVRAVRRVAVKHA